MEQVIFDNVINPVVKFLTGQITKHLGYATCSTKHVNNMRNKMKELDNKIVEVNKHTSRNNINSREIPAGVPDWLNDVDILKESVQSTSSDHIGCLNLKTRYQAGKKACEDTDRINELITKYSGFEWTDALIPTRMLDSEPARMVDSEPTRMVDSEPASTTIFAPSLSSSHGDDFKSREKTCNDTLKLLQQDNNKSQVIALCGIGGVGKTTMMEQLRAHEDIKKVYQIVKVAIGEKPNLHSVQNDIAIGLGGERPQEETVAERADSLCRKFKATLENVKNEKNDENEKNGKKLLVILDDVWQDFNLKDIGLPSPLPDRIKLLLTSRSYEVCKQITSGLLLELVAVNLLDEMEAQILFSRTTGVSEKDDYDLYQIGCDIAKKCGGLPLAINLIGKTLKSKEIRVWRSTLKRLKNNHFDDKVQEIVKISYEHIKDDEEKEILLHCSLFPEDYEIPIEDLTRYAWGLYLLKDVSTLGEARDRTYACVKNLIDANLLMTSDYIGCVKVHDIVLSFMLGEVSRTWIVKHGGASKWSRDEMNMSCQRLSLTCTGMSEIPIELKYQNPSLLQLMNGDQLLKFPEEFYEHMDNLKVIVHYEMQYPLLPRSLQCSTNLISLCLHGCKLMFDISFVGDLVNLEVLSFAHCGISKLPSTIGKLIKLKLLDLTGCVDLHIEDGVFKNLENLEELYMRAKYWDAIRFTDANFNELKMLSKPLSALEVEFVEEVAQLKNVCFTELYKFKIAIGCMLEYAYISERNSFENTLKVVTNHSSDLLGCKVDVLFKKTENLYLQVQDMTSLEDIVSVHLYDQRLFRNLSDLEVSYCDNLKYIFPMSVASGLTKLERLKISSCPVLETLVQNYGNIDEMIRFEGLKFLSLKKLPKLKSLFLVDNVVELPQLVELEVDGLPNFTSIYPDKNNISASQQPFLNCQVKIPKLEKLKVKCMEELMHIWACSSGEEVNNISLLREIEVEGCDNLVNLFPTNPMRLLNHLESLKVRKCGSIEVIFNIDLDNVGHEVEKLSSNSLRSIEVFDSKKVKEVWRINGGENNSSSISGFKDVESIEIRRCTSLRNVFSSRDINYDMRAVVDISIYDWGESGRNKELINVISSEEIPEVAENVFNVAFPSYLIPTFPHHLSNLILGGSDRVKVVFEISNGESATNQDPQQQTLLFPYLKDLSLNSLERMTHVWKCDNWNTFLILPKQSSFHNLTTIEMWGCNRIKYLFSPLMAKLLSNLQNINIRWCEDIEELVSNRDDDKDEEMTTSTDTHSTTKFFPHLHSLSFYDLGNLKRIGGGVYDEYKFARDGVGFWSLCQYSKKIEIQSCDTLSSVIPYYAVGQMQKLEGLEVISCKSLMEVFETQGINNKNNGGDSTNIDEGNGGTNTTVPRLENINVAQLSNLKKLVILSCRRLQHVFPFSTLKSLKKLEELMIKACNAMEVIVKIENEEQIEDVEFRGLKSLELHNLPNLEGFFLGTNKFQWPSLEKVMLKNCPKMMVFTSGLSTAPKLKYIHTSLGKHSLERGLNFHVPTNQTLLPPSSQSTSMCSVTLEPAWSFHNLIELHMERNHNVKCIIPSNELQQLQMLETIQISGCSYIEEVFDESKTVVEIPDLRHVELEFLPRLQYIWKSNHRLLEFPNLTTLSIDNCKRIEHVFTSSMVGSLQQLQDLHISFCRNMKVIVKEEEEEEESDVKVKEIEMLPCLKSLKLEDLESLKGFWLGKDDFSWPNLATLKIKECPNITDFTKGHVATPELNVIETSFGRCYIREDINSFIKTKQGEDSNSRR